MIIQAISYGEINTARLPKEYQEVEYIQSSGTQYINTGFKPNQDTRVVCDVDYTLTSATAWLFGARTSNQVKTYNVLTYSSKYRSDYNNITTDAESSVNPTGRFVLDKDKNITRFDGVVGVSLTYAVFQCDYTMYLFANNNAGTAASHGTFKLYSCQMYDNGTLVRDYVPCYRKSDSVAGLYDLVNNVFYANAGTGTFIKGADVGGSGSSGETFAFAYSGAFTDSRVDGIGDVTLNTSGTLTVTGKAVTVSVYILGAGGGASYATYYRIGATGGGGGNQTIETELTPGTYEIVIGTGGVATNTSSTHKAAGNGGDTTAFGATSTGGGGARSAGNAASCIKGAAGTPNGGTGTATTATAANGGSPNGGAIVSGVAKNGGDGLVRITFS